MFHYQGSQRKTKGYELEIEYLREKMIAAAKTLGLNHPDVIMYSQKIDRAHNLLLKHAK